jgi:hypothetical protein
MKNEGGVILTLSGAKRKDLLFRAPSIAWVGVALDFRGSGSLLIRGLSAILLCAALAWAQTTPAPPHSSTPTPGLLGTPGARPDAMQIARQFGPAFHPVAKYAVLTADLLTPGTDDAVVVATAENALPDQIAYHYKVVDPFGDYFGWGNPKDTAPFTGNIEKPLLLLVVENWRAPGRKFVIVNLPFEKLSLSRAPLPKRSVAAIAAEEVSGAKSLVYWDGKKWRWKQEFE